MISSDDEQLIHFIENRLKRARRIAMKGRRGRIERSLERERTSGQIEREERERETDTHSLKEANDG